MARAENIRVIYSDLSEEWHWKAGRHRKSHIRFGEGVLEKYRRKRQLAGSLLYRTHGSEGRRSQQCDLLTRHIAMRLHHAEQVAGTLSTETLEQVKAKAVIVAEVDRPHWRIWNGKAKDAQITLESIREVMPVFQGE